MSTTSIEVTNETINCAAPAAVTLPKEIFAFEMVSMEGYTTGRFRPARDMTACILSVAAMAGVESPAISTKKLSEIKNTPHGKKADDIVIFPDKENGLRTNLVTLASIEPTTFTVKADALNWFPKYKGSWMDNVGFKSEQEKLPRMRLF